MVLFNYSTRELTAKIVYYGPGLCGKTTNLQFIHENLPGEVRGKMLSLATKTDRTLFFDFLPIDLGEIRGMKTRVQLYTVPGQVFYNETRKLVLKGADGIVFVADSQETMLGANVESFKNLEENLRAHGMKLADIPHVIQFNKRDLPRLSAIEDLNAALNKYNSPFYESVATTGIGVQDTLKAIVKLVLLNLTKKYDPKSVPAAAGRAAASLSAVPTSTPTPAPIPPPVVAAAAPHPARGEAPRGTPAARAGSASGVGGASIPLSPVIPTPVAARTPAPAAASMAPAPATVHASPRAAVRTSTPDAMPAFDDAEIDGLVDEVEELPAPAEAAPLLEPVEVAAAPAEESDQGIWLGTPEGDEATEFAGMGASTVAAKSLDEFFASESPQDVGAPSPYGSPFEVDRGFDPEWSSAAEPAATEAIEAGPAPVPRVRAPERVAVPAEEGARGVEEPEVVLPFPLPTSDDSDDPGEDVLLTEVASDDDLFSDPSLDVARMTDGETREIVVPVVLGAGESQKRYKLAIRLRLEPVD